MATHPLLPSPAPQTYTAPQSAGQYRYIMGGGTFVGTGDYLDEEVPGGADKRRMTQGQVRVRMCVCQEGAWRHKQRPQACGTSSSPGGNNWAASCSAPIILACLLVVPVQIDGFAAYQKVSNALYDIVDQVRGAARMLRVLGLPATCWLPNVLPLHACSRRSYLPAHPLTNAPIDPTSGEELPEETLGLPPCGGAGCRDLQGGGRLGQPACCNSRRHMSEAAATSQYSATPRV